MLDALNSDHSGEELSSASESQYNKTSETAQIQITEQTANKEMNLK